jgi:hypothetical protein
VCCRISSVKLLSNLPASPISVAILPLTKSLAASTSATALWEAGVPCGKRPTELLPWTETVVECPTQPEGATVLVMSPGNFSACDVRVLAQPPWIQGV